MILLDALITAEGTQHKEGQRPFKVSDGAGSPDPEPRSFPLGNSTSCRQERVGMARREQLSQVGCLSALIKEPEQLPPSL